MARAAWAAWLATQGHPVNRKRVQRVMRLIGLVAVDQRPNTSKPAAAHKVYPYLLGGLSIDRVNQVWCSDITYIPMAKGFLYLVAIMDWHSRAVLAWRLSNTLGADFCVEALEEALARFGRPEIFNTDQGSQFTSDDFTGVLSRHEVTISMDGKGRCMDNVFIERLWRSLKYEEVYLHAYGTVAAAKAGIGAWLVFYNEERQHQSHGYRTPRQVYEAQCRWICGRSALPTGCASPASRASSKSGQMLAFAHIPTGTTTNTRIDQKGFDGRVNQRLNGDRSRHRNPRGYTLKHGSGCRTIGVHLTHHRSGRFGGLRFRGAVPHRRGFECLSEERRYREDRGISLSER